MASKASPRKIKIFRDTPIHFAATVRFTKIFVKPRWHRPALEMDQFGLYDVSFFDAMAVAHAVKQK